MSSNRRTDSSDSDSESDASFHSAQSDAERVVPSQPTPARQQPAGLEDAFSKVFTDEIPDSAEEPIREMFAPDVKEEPPMWEGIPRDNLDTSSADKRTPDIQNEANTLDARDEGSENEDEGDQRVELKDEEAEIEELLSPAETEVGPCLGAHLQRMSLMIFSFLVAPPVGFFGLEK